MKRCSKCEKFKPDYEFPKRANGERGLRSHCRKCISEYDKERNGTPEMKAKMSAYSKQYIVQNVDKVKSAKLLNRYGISLEEFEKKLDSQNRKCAICGVQLDGNKRTHLDHDHATGKIRGILCWNCNGGLGNFSDNVERLQSAINYLKGWKE